jgi:NAD dependent epimerase/dehydratase family enzyme
MLALPFRFFAGGRVGSGDQYWSWIHREDWTRMVRWAIDTAAIKGALNVTAPSPATNREFTQALARALHRHALVPAPAFAVRLMLGEMADALILNGQRVLPARLRQWLRVPVSDLDSALRADLSIVLRGRGCGDRAGPPRLA